jgi:hypothetical protein
MEASAETLKGILLGGDDLEKYYKFMTSFLDVISSLVESMGGLRGIFIAVGAAMLKMY